MSFLSVRFAAKPISLLQALAKFRYDLARIMRLVTWAGICHEAGERQYKATAATHLITTPGLSGGEKHQYGSLDHSSLHSTKALN